MHGHTHYTLYWHPAHVNWFLHGKLYSTEQYSWSFRSANLKLRAQRKKTTTKNPPQRSTIPFSWLHLVTRPKQKVPFHLHGGESAGNVSHHETLAQANGHSCSCCSWHQFLSKPMQKVQWRKVEYFGMKCVGSQRGTGWTRFLPIPAFQWRSYFWAMLYKASGTVERNTTQLEEMSAWHIWHCMRSCHQG